MWGWIVAAAVVVAAGAFYFWPTLMQAPTIVPPAGELSQGSLQEDMSGTWRSEADPKFTREFRADGVVIDRYEGEVSAGINGSWSVVNPAEEEMLSSIADSLANTTVIKVVWEGGVETTYFSVNALTDSTLSITDRSGRGGVTLFTKI